MTLFKADHLKGRKKNIKKLKNININRKNNNNYSFLEDKKSLTPFLNLEILDVETSV